MTDLISLFVLTGSIQDGRPASLMLISDPGTGKTELIERFKPNRNLSFHTDLTWKGLMPILRGARRMAVTHLVLTEFQKLFQRKMSTAENCLGTIVQAMEEGVFNVGVGGNVDYGGIRLGLVGAITHGTMEKRIHYLNETGFLSRAVVVPWEPPENEVLEIMRRVKRGDRRDLEPVVLDRPDQPVDVAVPIRVGDLIEKFVWERYRASSLRPLMRFRSLACAQALRSGRRKVTLADWDYVEAFRDYWDKARKDAT